MKHFYLKHILMSICLFLGLNAFAQEIVDIDGLRYYIDTEGAQAHVEHSDYTLNDWNHQYVPSKYSGDVVIPASVTYGGNTYVVTRICDSAFSGCTGLTSVEIPSTVTSIAPRAFYECCNITTITLPNSITEIGSSAFGYCSALTSLAIPDNVKNIYSNVFSGCHSLASIQLPSQLETIENYAFQGCIDLGSITIPNSVKQILKDAFRGCIFQKDSLINNSSLTYSANWGATLCDEQTGDGLLMIGDTIVGCRTWATSVTIPDNVKTIPDYLFNGYPNLTSVYIGKGVTSLGEMAFRGCSKLSSIQVDAENETYDSRDNCNAIIEKATNTLIVGCCKSTVPNGVVSIGNYAFSRCFNLASITLPNTVESVGDYAFEDCYNLSTVAIGRGLKSVGCDAFWFCSNLSKVIVPDTGLWYDISFSNPNANPLFRAHYLWSDEFTKITEITIPNDITNIKDYVFCGCYALTDVSIPNSVTSIGDGAFRDCQYLSSIAIPNSVTSIGECAFTSCDGLTSITIPNSVTSIERSAFSYCNGLTSITIPNSVTSIGDNAFYNCLNLTSAIIANDDTKRGVTKASDVSENSGTNIGSDAFAYCQNLTSVTIGSGVASIGERAFVNCNNLVSVTLNSDSVVSASRTNSTSMNTIFGEQVKTYIIGDSVNSIGDYAFYHCTGLTSIIISDSVTSIGSNAFRDCTSLTSIINGNGITSIGSDAFKGAAWYDNQPDGLIYIGKVAYMYKGEMAPNTHIIIEDGTTEIASNAFNGYDALSSIDIPNSVIRIGERAFNGCYSLSTITIPNSLTTIEKYAFRNCTGLTSLNLGNSVKSIGENAFYGCTNLISVSGGDNITNIERRAFDNTAWYNNLPDGLNYLGKVAYKYKGTMPSETQILIKEGTLGIAAYAFDGCSGMTSVVMPSSMTFIGIRAFSRCTNLLDVYCYAANVPEVAIVRSSIDAPFYKVPTSSATLHVPAASLDAYSTTSPWSGFGSIVPIADEDAISEIKALPVAIQSQGGCILVTGISDGSQITVCDISGKFLGTTVAAQGCATIRTNLPAGSIVIVNTGGKTFKAKI